MTEHDYEQEPTTGGTSIATVVAEGDPDMIIAVLEKKAALANRMRQAIETVVISQTYVGDWTIQGKNACLASAGAERIGRNFPIAYRDVKGVKEDFDDSEGKAYRYVYTGYASLYDRTVYAEANYSTRDEFLGRKDGQWRPLEDINEGDIRSAAYHIFCGNAIKELLGLRNIPADEYSRIMSGTGRDATKSSAVQRGKGTQGGSSEEEHGQQKELAELCMRFANDGQTVEKDLQGNWQLRPITDSDSREGLEIAKDICCQISAFTGKDKTEVPGRGAKELKGQRLAITLATARKLAGIK